MSPSAVIYFFGVNMSNIRVRLSYDPTGRNPDNLIGSEAHDLKPVSGFPYKIITLEHGGYYTKSLRVYDANYNKLTLDQDYIITYRHDVLSKQLGLDICSAIVFLDKTRTGNVFTSAQMVGGDMAFSLTVIPDYVTWYGQQIANYVPQNNDFNGNEPQWQPGELDKERWRLDTFEPFNNEIYEMSRAVSGATGTYEQDFRDKVKVDYNAFLDLFNDRLELHIQDKANPHVDVKDDIGLNLMQNYELASDAIARAGTSNAHFMTPLLSWATVDELALKPLNVHINNHSNPHRTTPATLSAPLKTEVNAKANTKYLRNEQVANTDYFDNGTTPYSYANYYYAARYNLPALGFAAGGGNGYIDPRRIGRGTPTSTTALNGDGVWVDWATIIVQHGAPPSPVVVTVGAFGDRNTGHNFVISQPWQWTVPVGSLALYYVDALYRWGTGNGSWQLGGRTTCGSYKSASGWIMI